MQPDGRNNSPKLLASSGDLSSPGGAFFVTWSGASACFARPLMNRSSLLLRVALLGVAAFAGTAALGVSALGVSAWAAPAKSAQALSMESANGAWQKPLEGDEKILNALNRLTFGPRPGDVAAIKKQGFNRWINAQLNPASIDDSELEKELKTLSMLDATPDTLMLAYQVQNGNIRRALMQMQAAKEGKTLKGNDAKEVRLNARDQESIKRFQESGMDPGASYQALGELTAAKLARATDSNRQLQEVLVDFWSNHFNLDVNKGPVQVLKVLDDRDTIRPNVMGSFRQLLGASAHSPAMLWYLDNAKSTVEIANKGNGKKRGGLNENYAREIMELHTLGVDGGYTQKDVTEVARCFTGWSIGGRRENDDYGFRFNARAHDNGEKIVLGQKIPAGGGEKDGELVLDILAAHPATSKHLAFKLCQRFIADAPPQSAVDAVAAAFTQSKGDLTKTYRALFATPEFSSQGAYRAKIKSPLEFAVSAVRALDGRFSLPDPDNPRQQQWLVLIGRSARERNNNRGNLPRRPLATEIATMGQPLWGYQAPTGYPENSAQWVSSSALIARLNFALALTTGRVGDIAIEKDTFRNTSVAAVAQNLLSEPLSAQSLATIGDEIKATPADGAKLRALILGSPEFQRR